MDMVVITINGQEMRSPITELDDYLCDIQADEFPSFRMFTPLTELEEF